MKTLILTAALLALAAQPMPTRLVFAMRPGRKRARPPIPSGGFSASADASRSGHEGTRSTKEDHQRYPRAVNKQKLYA